MDWGPHTAIDARLSSVPKANLSENGYKLDGHRRLDMAFSARLFFFFQFLELKSNKNKSNYSTLSFKRKGIILVQRVMSFRNF